MRRHLPANCRHLSPQGGVHGVVNLGGVVKTLRRGNSLSRTVFSTAGSFGIVSFPASPLTPTPVIPKMMIVVLNYIIQTSFFAHFLPI